MNGDRRLIRDCAKHSDCVLNRKMPALKKIKAFCKECAADFKPKECNGKVLNTPETRAAVCPLHLYRLGKNPFLKGRGNVKNLIPFRKTRDKTYV